MSHHPTLTVFLTTHSLHLTPHPTKHRLLTTTKPIPAGTTLFTSPALATTTSDPNTCHYCFRPCEHISRCKGCKKSLYCGTTCQIRDWKGGHSVLCKLWQKRGGNGEEEMLIKVLIALTHDTQEEMDRVNRETFLTLIGHPETLTLSEKEEWGKILTTIQQLKPFVNRPDCDMKTLTTYLARFRSNNFTITTPDIFPIGEGTFPVGSLLNHSCDPNCIVLYDGRRQVVRVVRDVGVDEELVTSYVDGMVSRSERMAMLEERYGFRCGCRRCSGEDGVDELLGNETVLSEDEKVGVDAWLEKECGEGIGGLVCGLHDIFFRSNMDTPSSIIQRKTKDRTSLSEYILNTFRYLPPRTLLSSSAVYTTAHKNLLSHVNTTSDSSIPLHTRPIYTHLSSKLHTTLHTTPSPLLSLYTLCMYLVVYGRYHPLTVLQFVLASKLCWNEIVISEEEDVQCVEVVRELIRVGKRVCEVCFGSGYEGMRDVDDLEEGVEGELKRLNLNSNAR